MFKHGQNINRENECLCYILNPALLCQFQKIYDFWTWSLRQSSSEHGIFSDKDFMYMQSILPCTDFQCLFFLDYVSWCGPLVEESVLWVTLCEPWVAVAASELAPAENRVNWCVRCLRPIYQLMLVQPHHSQSQSYSKKNPPLQPIYHINHCVRCFQGYCQKKNIKYEI